MDVFSSYSSTLKNFYYSLSQQHMCYTSIRLLRAYKSIDLGKEADIMKKLLKFLMSLYGVTFSWRNIVYLY